MLRREGRRLRGLPGGRGPGRVPAVLRHVRTAARGSDAPPARAPTTPAPTTPARPPRRPRRPRRPGPGPATRAPTRRGSRPGADPVGRQLSRRRRYLAGARRWPCSRPPPSRSRRRASRSSPGRRRGARGWLLGPYGDGLDSGARLPRRARRRVRRLPRRGRWRGATRAPPRVGGDRRPRRRRSRSRRRCCRWTCSATSPTRGSAPSDGLNPYDSAPADIPDDPAGSRVEDYRFAVSVYGPLFTLATYPLGLVGVPAALWVLKGAAAASRCSGSPRSRRAWPRCAASPARRRRAGRRSTRWSSCTSSAAPTTTA